MRRNGFTLLELLGVIVLLGVVAVLVVTVSNRILGKSRDSLYETQIETLTSAAKNWTAVNNGVLPLSSSEGVYKLNVSQLASDGYIDSDELIDPRSNDEICGYFEISYNDSKKQYDYNFVSQSC